MTAQAPALRSRLRVAGLAVLSTLSGACAPPANALVTRCTNEMMAAGDPRTCEVTAERLDGEQTATFDIARGYSQVDVTVALEAGTGVAEVRIDQVPGQTWRLAAGAPLHVTLPVPTDRGLQGFLLRVRPAGGAVERVTGSVRYRARVSD